MAYIFISTVFRRLFVVFCNYTINYLVAKRIKQFVSSIASITLSVIYVLLKEMFKSVLWLKIKNGVTKKPWSEGTDRNFRLTQPTRDSHFLMSHF